MSHNFIIAQVTALVTQNNFDQQRTSIEKEKSWIKLDNFHNNNSSKMGDCLGHVVAGQFWWHFAGDPREIGARLRSIGDEFDQEAQTTRNIPEPLRDLWRVWTNCRHLGEQVDLVLHTMAIVYLHHQRPGAANLPRATVRRNRPCR